MKSKLYVHIINWEAGIGMDGILTKYAARLEQSLANMGVMVTVSDKPNEKADVNHHINFLAYKPTGTIDTTMVTHVSGDKSLSENVKINILKKSLETSFGIAMSKSLMEHCIELGANKDKLDFTTHAHDGLSRRPRIIAICTNIYPDGRKREEMFVDMFRSLKNKKGYIFRIMGKGWQPILKELSKEGLQADWLEEFDLESYQSLLGTADYLLYTGDEDSLAQSMVDAKNCNLRIVAPPNKDLTIDIPFQSQQELNTIFAYMDYNEVETWTWKEYAKKHLTIWEKLYETKSRSRK